MGSRHATALLFFAFLLGCSDSSNEGVAQSQPTLAPSLALESVLESAVEPTTFQQVDWDLSTHIESGSVDLYSLVEGRVTRLDRLHFQQSPTRVYARYETPVDATDSYLLAHVSTLSEPNPGDREALCFVRVVHHGNRNQAESPCDHASTITFYMSATRILPSQDSPFADAPDRILLWSELFQARENDLVAFFVSAFSTLENALLDMGQARIDPRYQSIRPIMETIIAKALDIYQRDGALDGIHLVEIANTVTGNELPLSRLNSFFEVFNRYVHIEPVQLRHTGGTLTRRNRTLELLTLDNEIKRFYLQRSPLEMSDYRTHTVQNVRHEPLGDLAVIRWDPLPHMFGYNVYLNRQHVGSTVRSDFTIRPVPNSTVTIHAVGHAGEFDGQRYELPAEAAEL